MFNLPGRGLRQRTTSTSSVPITLNDVIVHVRQFVVWFSVIAWSVRADLLMVDINLFFAPCVFSIFRVVYVLSVFLQSCFN